jgi:hypothetical protein
MGPGGPPGGTGGATSLGNVFTANGGTGGRGAMISGPRAYVPSIGNGADGTLSISPGVTNHFSSNNLRDFLLPAGGAGGTGANPGSGAAAGSAGTSGKLMVYEG